MSLFEPTPAPRVAGSHVRVALNLPLDTEFTYAVPPGMQLRVGNRVLVPFRNRVLPGVVVAADVEPGDVPVSRIRAVHEVLDADLLLPEGVLALARRIAQEYGSSVGEALDAALPAAVKRRGARTVPHLELAIPAADALELTRELEEKQGARSRVLRTVLEFGAPMQTLDVQRRTKTSPSPWQTLVRQKVLRRVWLEEDAEPFVPSQFKAERHDLNARQQEAVDAAAACARVGEHAVFLLHGVTGSGKTEVYLRILEVVRSLNKSAIVLVPEISLTPQTVGRFASRFPDVAVLHSGLTAAERGDHWRRLMGGTASIAIGARSALFAPVRQLGLIVVDEEHESSFKQENTPRYHAREMAVARGEIEGAVVVLGSATPSLESYGRARRGVYRLLELPERAGAGKLPRILVEDLRKEAKSSYVGGVMISRTLRVLMKERLDVKDQVILFLNRRGYSPVLICGKCGEAMRCQHCDISMTLHRRVGRLVCHYCNHEQRVPPRCPVCDNGPMHDLGAGTERVEEAVKTLFPNAIVQRMDADTMSKRGAHERVLEAFRKRQIDVLIGTQMIAKGLDFPDVTLVGVVSADTGLLHPDFRAAERTFHLLYQVAGRAGRAEKAGTVVFQTLCPENYAVRAAAKLDFEAFVQQELAYRKEAGYPPFSRLLRVLLEGRKPDVVRQIAAELRARLPADPDLSVLGPAPAPIERIKDRLRVHFLVKARTREAFARAMAPLRDAESLGTATLRVTLDVDPSAMT
ncbi:MAG: primosomal protein N' [Planctomycetota bacterium]